jgi:hypothetical protein
MEKIESNIVKVFISYSWKPISNKTKTQNLAERLTNDGVHVVFDDWDLKEGQDKYQFMEQMVNDPSVSKVLLVCNKEYAEKANKKVGGVGIESLIISDEIYNQADQTKFIPIVMEYYEEGKACMPTFVKTRIFIDLSDESLYEENYEKLLRNIYNKPKSKRPPIGKMPIHLVDENPIFLPTAHKVSTIKTSLLNANHNSSLLIKDYLDTFINSLIQFKIDYKSINEHNFIEEVEKSVLSLQSLKNDFIEFLNVLFKFSAEKYDDVFIDFFEKLIQFYEDHDISLYSGNSLNDMANDNYRFFNYDLFLSFSTILLLNEKFYLLAFILKNNFILIKKYRQTELVNFVHFRHYNYTLNEYKNKSLNSKRISVTADLIKQYATILKFEDLKRTDILLYYISLFYPSKETYSSGYWFPETSCYNSYTIEVLPKLISKRYFEKIKILFDVENESEFKAKIEMLNEKDSLQRGYYGVPNIKAGLNFDNVGTYN